MILMRYYDFLNAINDYYRNLGKVTEKMLFFGFWKDKYNIESMEFSIEL
jgi:hypothetical protein